MQSIQTRTKHQHNKMRIQIKIDFMRIQDILNKSKTQILLITKSCI